MDFEKSSDGINRNCAFSFDTSDNFDRIGNGRASYQQNRE